MKLIIAFLILSVAFAEKGWVVNTLENVAVEIAKKIHVKFDVETFWLGVNNQLELATNPQVETCLKNFLPTLELLSGVTQAIEQFQWDVAFEYNDALKSQMDAFKSNCQDPYNAYAQYLGPAMQAFQTDQPAFFHNVWEDIKADKYDSLIHTVSLIANIVDNDDNSAGDNFADLMQIALKYYLPTH